MSASIYDTAWMSMVSKKIDGETTWLFPSSFQYIYDTQDEEGGWQNGDEIDSILNTLACLLSFLKHRKLKTDDDELDDKIDSATQFLTTKLAGWDISTTDRIGIEITIPNMLDMLELEGIHFAFPELNQMREANKARMKQIDLSLMYKFSSSILYSLESFIGVIDFDKLSQYLRNGSMMGSPSSTAAYLMNASTWDESAEQYLRDAIENGKRIADGVVTNVFPLSTFEFAWVIFRNRK